jgi:cbb3-type cytochrome oxidase subunit 3
MGFAASIGVVTLIISIIASIFFIRQAGKEFY